MTLLTELQQLTPDTFFIKSMLKITKKKKREDLPLTITHKLNKTGKDRCLIQFQYELKCANLQKYST